MNTTILAVAILLQFIAAGISLAAIVREKYMVIWITLSAVILFLTFRQGLVLVHSLREYSEIAIMSPTMSLILAAMVLGGVLVLSKLLKQLDFQGDGLTRKDNEGNTVMLYKQRNYHGSKAAFNGEIKY